MPHYFYKIPANKFVSYLKGDHQDEPPGIFYATGKELLAEKHPISAKVKLKEDEQYYVVSSVEIRLEADAPNFLISSFNVLEERINLIFDQCKIPSVFFRGCQLGDWVLYDSIIENITFQNCLLQDISFYKQSKCDFIVLKESSCNDICITESSSLKNIELSKKSNLNKFNVSNKSLSDILLFDDSTCGKIIVDSEAKCGFITFRNNSRCDTPIKVNASQCVGIKVESSSICKDLHFEDNSKISFIHINKSEAGRINLSKDCNCETILIFNGAKCGDIYLSNSCSIGQINVNGGSLADNVTISGASDVESVIVSGAEIKKLEINADSVLQKLVLLERGICKDIDVSYLCSCRSIRILDESAAGNIKLSDGSFCRLIEVVNSRTGLVSLNSQFITLIFRNASVLLIDIVESYVQRLVWSLGSKGDIYMTGGAIHHLDLRKTALVKDVVFKFSEVLFRVVQLEDLLVHGHLLFANIKSISDENSPGWEPRLKAYYKRVGVPGSILSKFKKYMEEDYEEWGKEQQLLAEKFASAPIFRIVNSSLGKMEIIGSDLTGFCFEYRNSRLLDCFISGTQMPKENVRIYNYQNGITDIEECDLYEQKISFYNQLRRLYESLGDVVEASWYQSKAMDNQQKLLQLNYIIIHKPKWFELNKRFSEEGFNLFTFRLNKWSNNHGESWRKGLVFIFTISFSFYLLYYCSIYYNHAFLLSNIDVFIGDYFSFLDITHKIDFLVAKDKVPPLSKFIDFVARIFIGYGIFQFVAAFRKHGRRVA